MNNEKYNQIIDEVYDKYTDKYIGYEDVPNRALFIHEIKTNPSFSEKWGLKIDERELSFEERYVLYFERLDSNMVPLDIKVPNIHQYFTELNIPTKLITITYNDIKTEVYE